MDDRNLVIHPKGEDGHSTFSIRIKTELKNRIDMVAAQSNRSRNEIIAVLLEYALDRCTVAQADEPKETSALPGSGRS